MCSFQITRLQFHASASLAGLATKLTFVHHHGRPTSTLEAAVSLDSRNKVIVRQRLHGTRPALKLEHVRGGTTVEPSYDFSNSVWTLAVKTTVGNGYTKLSYNDAARRAELEISQPVEGGGTFKVSPSTHCFYLGPRYALITMLWFGSLWRIHPSTGRARVPG